MSCKILILGASYGSLLGTKLLMAGHDVTLVCRSATADLINSEGTEVRIKLRDEDSHRRILSQGQKGRVDAKTPEEVDPAAYDFVGLAMQEPQYSDPALRQLLDRVADARVPCISIMNMPPLPYLKRIPGLDCDALAPAFTDAKLWQRFDPSVVTLCSPDPQAFRPPEEKPNILHVGLPTNFKVAQFGQEETDRKLQALAQDIAEVRIDGKDVPVKLRIHESLFVPFAKWSMLATGNYRCVTKEGFRPIRDAVQDDLELSREIYDFVESMVVRLGAEPSDMVPFEKYAQAANGLLKPSSAARAIAAGSVTIERVDRLVQLIGKSLGMQHPEIDATVAIVDAHLEANREKAA
ncbi:ketopantoate reductase family protein [Pelagibius sp. Alg239-R121]|uniref:ketopantoate reductase family protein n=1 Tax=Pelagibius sp. Alg239-R121 TaxID=2993448 RepID=UPI0024A63A3A|nr:2-dehydropantoate 2-reductase N-terminal domain-containing protein [Pelagibius sp. Alg239-R121]